MGAIRKILLIEDDTDDQELFLEAVNQVDPTIEVKMMENGKVALQHLSADCCPDLILADLNMPKMNGKQFLIELKQNPGLAHIPVYIFSTSSTQSEQTETKSLGAFDFLVKPDRYDALCDLVRKILA